jgi:hypothetical protein
LLLAKTSKGKDPIFFSCDVFWVLADHEPKIVQRFLILSQTEVRHRTSETGIDIIRLGFELLVHTRGESKGNVPVALS